MLSVLCFNLAKALFITLSQWERVSERVTSTGSISHCLMRLSESWLCLLWMSLSLSVPRHTGTDNWPKDTKSMSSLLTFSSGYWFSHLCNMIQVLFWHLPDSGSALVCPARPYLNTNVVCIKAIIYQAGLVPGPPPLTWRRVRTRCLFVISSNQPTAGLLLLLDRSLLDKYSASVYLLWPNEDNIVLP